MRPPYKLVALTSSQLWRNDTFQTKFSWFGYSNISDNFIYDISSYHNVLSNESQESVILVFSLTDYLPDLGSCEARILDCDRLFVRTSCPFNTLFINPTNIQE